MVVQAEGHEAEGMEEVERHRVNIPHYGHTGQNEQRAYINIVSLAEIHLPIGAALDFQIAICVDCRD